LDRAWFPSALLASCGMGVGLRAVWEAGTVHSAIERVLRRYSLS
jgi:hypothetical protein